MKEKPPPTHQPSNGGRKVVVMSLSNLEQKDNGGCEHPHRQFVRVPFVRKDGITGEHVREECRDCGENCRGGGIWVGRAELLRRGVDPATLPVQGQTQPSSLSTGSEGTA